MTVRLRIVPKLTLVFVMFAALVLFAFGVPAYYIARAALERSTVSDLLSAAIEKESALDRWVEARKTNLVRVAGSHHIRQHASALLAVPPGSEAARSVRKELLTELRDWVGEVGAFESMFVIEPIRAEVVVSTLGTEVGTFKENRSFFLKGRDRPYVQNPYYSVTRQGPVMTISAPIRTPEGSLSGVLVGRLKLSEMNAIVGRRTGLRATDDAYLVNASHLFVTQPRLVDDPAVLQRGIYTPLVDRCLAGENGSAMEADFRNVPVIAVYRWLSPRRLCLVVKVAQAEALAAVGTLGRATLGSAVLVLLIAGLLSAGLARMITRPILALRAGAMAIGRGDPRMRLPEESTDELGQLAHEFNAMTTALEERSEALRDSEAQYKSLFENAQVMMHVLDREGRLKSVNDAWLDTLGYRRDQVIGRMVLEFMTADSAHYAKTVVLPKLAKLGRVSDVSYTFVKQDGEPVDVLLSAIAETDDQGAMVQGHDVLVDVTERKRAEAALKELNERLEDRVEARTAELRAAQEALLRKSRLAALGQLTGTVSHELRNPLGALRIAIAAVDKMLPEAPPALARTLAIANRSVSRCDEIITDLLEYSRVRALDRSDLALDGWLTGILDEIEVPAGVTVSHALDCGLALAIDPERLRRAVRNVVENACQAMTPEDDDAAPAEERRLAVATRTTGGRVEIRVRDTGPGIDEATLAKIFEPLFSTKAFGVGLGMTVVKQIMEQHGGGIEIDSAPGRGTEVVLWLPLPEPARRAAS